MLNVSLNQLNTDEQCNESGIRTQTGVHIESE